MPHKRELIACSLWIAALFFLCFGTIDSARDGHNSPCLAWGVFLSVLALVPTVWLVIEHLCADREDTSLEHIIEVVDALHSGHGVTRMR